MVYNDPTPGSLKRKRRRQARDVSLSARLQLVDGRSGDLAEVSLDLIQDLQLDQGQGSSDHLYIAVKQWTPANPPSVLVPKWTILPCRPMSKEPVNSQSVIKVATRSKAFNVLSESLQLGNFPRSRTSAPTLEVRVTHAQPVVLETVYVTVDSESPPEPELSSKKHMLGSIARKPSARFNTTTNGSSPLGRLDEDPETLDELKRQVRSALKKSIFAYTGDSITLPSKKEKTKVPVAPTTATITACEPVAQGLLAETTRIVVVTTVAKPATVKKPTIPIEALAELEEEAANEAFYTAVEPDDSESKRTSFDLSDSEEDSDGNLSDDQEGLISLTSPTLGSQTPGMMSAITAATPKQFGLGKQATGVHTPGSVFSSMTAATFRGGHSVRTKVLKAQGLIERIPDELLYPKPFAYEDEEARVYVDTSVLARLGCFSGDWVDLTKAQDPALTGIASLAMSSFLDREHEESSDVRAVKVFGLPEILTNKAPAKYPIQGRQRSGSITSFIGRPNTPSVYLSPILLANLGDPTFLRLTPLRNVEEPIAGRPPGKMPPTSLPPAAKEANLLKVQSPVSIEKAVDSSVFNGLVSYFEGKQRLVKTGDLIAIAVDEEVGRAVYEGGSAEDGASNDVLNFFGSRTRKAGSIGDSTNVVWFQVGSLTSHATEDVEQPDVWNGLVSMVPSKTKMHQSGTEQRRVPPAMSSTWPYYEGVLQLPRTQDSGGMSLTKDFVSPASNLQKRIGELVATATSPRAIKLGLPPVAILLHSTQRNIGKSYTANQACLELGLHCFAVDAFDILTEAAGGGGDNNTVGTFESRTERALQCGPDNTCLLVEHIDALSSDRMYTAVKDKLEESRIIIATTTELDKVPETLRGLFTHELEMSAPDEAERETILKSVVGRSAVSVSPSVDLAAIAVKTAALVAGDLVDVVDRAVAARQSRLERLAENADRTSLLPITVHDLEIAGGDSILSLIPADFDLAVDEARKNFADAIGAPKIPNVQWSDVGGLANVKDAVIETIQLPLSRPELFAKGLKKRSGILFYGPPGTGKTLLAKAIATEFSLNFFSVKGPELLNMYIGESEANVRRVFQRARDARPCVVFFDELDSVAPKRGNQGDSGGVMDRIVSQLLAELDGMSDGDSEDGGGGAGVFVIGATNRPDLLDQALLRPGRFDKMLYLGVSDTHEKQQKILEALTRKFTLSPDLQLSSIAASLPFTYTGADLYALCSDAMLKAVTRSAGAVDSKIADVNATRADAEPPKPAITVAQFFDHHATDADLDVLVTDQDFRQAHAELVPSVSAEELGHYERVRREFEGGRDKNQQQQHSGQSVNGSAGGLGLTATQLPALPPNPTLEEMERWQAARIEQMMANGFKDGSLARNNPRDKGKARVGSYSSPPLHAGNGIDDGSSATRESRASTRATDDDTEDSSDLVVRTGSLSMNGSPAAANGGADKHDTGRPRERESRFFSSSKDKVGDKVKGKEKGRSGKSRTMSLFSKGKSKRQESVDHDEGNRNGDKGKDGFGDAARDKDLYD